MLKRVAIVIVTSAITVVAAAAGFGALGITTPLATFLPEATLHGTRSYYTGPYGLGAAQPPGPIAVGALAERGDSRAFERLARRSATAPRLYGLAGLSLTDKVAFEAVAASYGSDTTFVEVGGWGCMVWGERMGDVVAGFRAGAASDFISQYRGEMPAGSSVLEGRRLSDTDEHR